MISNDLIVNFPEPRARSTLISPLGDFEYCHLAFGLQSNCEPRAVRHERLHPIPEIRDAGVLARVAPVKPGSVISH